MKYQEEILYVEFASPNLKFNFTFPIFESVVKKKYLSNCINNPHHKIPVVDLTKH